jgi:hypothetical protein
VPTSSGLKISPFPWLRSKLVHTPVLTACLNFLGLGHHDKPFHGKGDEEGKIGSEHGGSSDHVFMLDSACAIGISEMIHQRSTLNTKSDHHLSYLAKCNAVIGDRRLNLQRLEAVVPVHGRVHRVIHGHEIKGLGSLGGIAVPAVEQNRHVVIPVKEDQRAFALYDEERVEELRDLRKNEELHPHSSSAETPTMLRVDWRGANGFLECPSGDEVKKMRDRPQGTGKREHAKEGVPASKKASRVPNVLACLYITGTPGEQQSSATQHAVYMDELLTDLGTGAKKRRK